MLGIIAAAVGFSVSTAWLFWLFTKRLRAKAAQMPLNKSSQSHILHLRSFREDATQTTTLTNMCRQNCRVNMLHEVAPVVTIGQTGQLLPPLGATRM